MTDEARRPRINLEARAAQAEARRERTRERLLLAAQEVIAAKGPETASIEDFVAAAGVSRGTFYNYFPTHDDLIRALNDEISESYDRALMTATAGVRDPALVLALLAHQAFQVAIHDPVRAWVALRIENTSAPRAAALAERFDSIFEWGRGHGRFGDVDITAARMILFGAARMAMSEILSGRADTALVTPLVTLQLTALGLPPDEAGELSREAEQAIREAHAAVRPAPQAPDRATAEDP